MVSGTSSPLYHQQAQLSYQISPMHPIISNTLMALLRVKKMK